jgi:diadenosine tetraphosphate (Ap4A) HIT family hydrolase
MLDTGRWVVEHTVGSLGLGTLIVKPRRHVVHVWELDDGEARELGPLLQRASAAVAELMQPDQVYVCLWSHHGGRPVHIHFVVQPATRVLMDEFGNVGPYLQTAMFDRGAGPPRDEVERFAERARTLLART